MASPGAAETLRPQPIALSKPSSIARFPRLRLGFFFTNSGARSIRMSKSDGRESPWSEFANLQPFGSSDVKIQPPRRQSSSVADALQAEWARTSQSRSAIDPWSQCLTVAKVWGPDSRNFSPPTSKFSLRDVKAGPPAWGSIGGIRRCFPPPVKSEKGGAMVVVDLASRGRTEA